jgi:hypothetical protein
MMPEDRVARIVHRLLMPNASFEGFARLLQSQKQMGLNRAVAFVADQIREAVEEARCPLPGEVEYCTEEPALLLEPEPVLEVVP